VSVVSTFVLFAGGVFLGVLHLLSRRLLFGGRFVVHLRESPTPARFFRLLLRLRFRLRLLEVARTVTRGLLFLRRRLLFRGDFFLRFVCVRFVLLFDFRLLDIL